MHSASVAELRQQLLQSLQAQRPEMVAHVRPDPLPTPAEVKRARTQAQMKLYAKSHAPVVPSSEQESGFVLVNEMRRHFVPTKKRGKKGKLTRNTSQWFNAEALKGTPGGSRTGSVNILAMIDAPETNCYVIDDSAQGAQGAQGLRERLSRSPENCNTTSGNYILTVTH